MVCKARLEDAISIHAPRTGSDDDEAANTKIVRFQSTLPARGATAADASRKVLDKKFQSTLPARGAT